MESASPPSVMMLIVSPSAQSTTVAVRIDRGIETAMMTVLRTKRTLAALFATVLAFALWGTLGVARAQTNGPNGPMDPNGNAVPTANANAPAANANAPVANAANATGGQLVFVENGPIELDGDGNGKFTLKNAGSTTLTVSSLWVTHRMLDAADYYYFSSF